MWHRYPLFYQFHPNSSLCVWFRSSILVLNSQIPIWCSILQHLPLKFHHLLYIYHPSPPAIPLQLLTCADEQELRSLPAYLIFSHTLHALLQEETPYRGESFCQISPYAHPCILHQQNDGSKTEIQQASPHAIGLQLCSAIHSDSATSHARPLEANR